MHRSIAVHALRRKRAGRFLETPAGTRGVSVYSATKVAESLAPRSPALASLKTRLGARGLAGISYDL